jgi:uncharacterized membrane protein YeaQ/YmgE (transglycosylase-associated protein family)
MTILEFVVYLIIAGLCGALARAIIGGTAGGFIVSILLGFLGAFLGTWIARVFHLPDIVSMAIGGQPFPIFWSVVGGIILVGLARLLVRPIYVNRTV